jgi:hypothetical protein
MAEEPLSNPIEAKWAANQAKADFARDFPGLLTGWEACQGKRIAQVLPLRRVPGAILVMDDGSFAVVGKLEPTTVAIQDGLEAAAAHLRPRYPEAFAELERLAQRDRELTRRARLEKILGAVTNNITEIPELKRELEQLLRRLPG